MRAIGFVLALLAALAPAAGAFAHASLIRSEPTDRTVVAQAPSMLALTFNEPVSPLVVRLVSPTGEATDLKDVVANNARLTTDHLVTVEKSKLPRKSPSPRAKMITASTGAGSWNTTISSSTEPITSI